MIKDGRVLEPCVASPMSGLFGLHVLDPRGPFRRIRAPESLFGAQPLPAKSKCAADAMKAGIKGHQTRSLG